MHAHTWCNAGEFSPEELCGISVQKMEPKADASVTHTLAHTQEKKNKTRKKEITSYRSRLALKTHWCFSEKSVRGMRLQFCIISTVRHERKLSCAVTIHLSIRLWCIDFLAGWIHLETIYSSGKTDWYANKVTVHNWSKMFNIALFILDCYRVDAVNEDIEALADKKRKSSKWPTAHVCPNQTISAKYNS